MSSSDDMNRMDKNVFHALSFEEAENYMRNYKSYTWRERLHISGYLTSIAYRFTTSNPPRMNKASFKMLKRN